ncbi:MAG: carboxypeptidase regulatory-like domain-containing protein [Candidatus Sericytochromatia bacterium]
MKHRHVGRSLTLTVALLLALPQPGKAAEAVNPGLWGSSGLLNVPTADVLESGGFYGGLRYFPLNTGLSGAATVSVLEDLEAGLVFGAPPANGFSALAASVKYRFMNQAKGQPVSLAVGGSLLGAPDTFSYVPGTQLFLTASRAFDWENQRLFNLHAGFMGGLGGARAVAGVDVPILDLARVEMEYMGAINTLGHAFNLGVVVTPHPNLVVELALMQRPTSFWDRDVILGVSYVGNWGNWFGLQPAVGPSPQASAQPSAQPSPQASASLRPPSLEKGSLKLRVIDRERITALSQAQVTLRQPSTGLSFSATTDVMGEALFERVPTGTYEVSVMREGWFPETRLLSVQPELETFLEVALNGQAAVLYGKIETAGGGVAPAQLDLELRDLANVLVRRFNLSSDIYRLEGVPPGQYTLLVRHAGEERLRLSVLAKGNAESQYDLTLPPLPPGSSPAPTAVPTVQPSAAPSVAPTAQPTSTPLPLPTAVPSATPVPTPYPTMTPPPLPSAAPTVPPTPKPTPKPTAVPSAAPSAAPTPAPNAEVIAQIEGLVSAKGGQPLAGVRMELKNDDLLVITLSNAQGKYAFRDIPKGVYRLTLSKDGYKKRAFQITIQMTETMQHNFELEPGS